MKQLDPNAPAYPVQINTEYKYSNVGLIDGQFISTEGGLTAKQHACIQLELPETGVDWLDELIKKKQLQTLAGQAMQGMATHDGSYFSGTALDLASNAAKHAILYAKALLNELNKEVI